MSTPISNHFSYEEFERSSKARELAIDNRIPSDKIRFALRILVLNLLQPLRDCLKRPLVVASGYRCPALNRAVGGSMSSQHMKGEAAMCSMYPESLKQEIPGLSSAVTMAAGGLKVAESDCSYLIAQNFKIFFVTAPYR